MKKCPFCAEEIQDAAIVCKHCGRELTKQEPTVSAPVAVPKERGKGCLAWGVLGLAAIAFFAWIGSQSSPTPTGSFDIKRAQDLVNQSRESGLITSFTCTGNEAEVLPGFWRGLDAGGKRGLTLSLAAICDSQNSGNRITVIDSQSGKTLATFFGGTYKVE